MVNKPTQIPEWAVNNVLDPISQQYNVVEPPPEKKLSGWARLEFPPRQWFNWLARLVYLWILWFKQQEEYCVVVDGTGDDAGFPHAGPNSLILWAIDSTDAGNYLLAFGHSDGMGVPQLTTISGSTANLVLASVSVDGHFVITPAMGGGTAEQIICRCQTTVLPS